MEEIWAQIPNFSRYLVSNFGNVWNDYFKRPMRPSLMGSGVTPRLVVKETGEYFFVNSPNRSLKISLIGDDGVRRSLVLASLVAQAFVEAPNDRCDTVVVLDGDLTNVAAYNLVWRTPRQAWFYSRQMKTQPKLYWTNLNVLNQSTGVLYENILQCGIAEGMLFQQIWESTFKGIYYREEGMRYEGFPTFPFGYRYEIIKRVQVRR